MSANDYQCSPPGFYDVTLSALRQYTDFSRNIRVEVGDFVVVSHAVSFGNYRYYAKPQILCVYHSFEQALRSVQISERLEHEYMLRHDTSFGYDFEVWHVVCDVSPELASRTFSDVYIEALRELLSVMPHV